jgi:methionine-S-sulfoxide reductase
MKPLSKILFGCLIVGGLTMATQSASKLEKATFAGGCFWCMEPPFEQLKGVSTVTAGYTGGHVPNPTYEQVCTGTTGHAEAVQVEYDPTQVTYDQLLEVFWRNIDPTQSDGQFADQGTQYRTSIFYHNEEQKKLAEASKAKLEATKKFSEPIVTEIVAAMPFYRAEDYHQGYARTNAFRYGLYRQGSGRAGYLKKTWGADH